MTEETTRRFLTRLWELQTERGIGNSDLARMLGISPSYVRHLKTRARVVRLGYNIALKAVQAFPELAPFLSADLPTSKEDETICNSGVEEAEPQ
jgi:hypothetical protein